MGNFEGLKSLENFGKWLRYYAYYTILSPILLVVTVIVGFVIIFASISPTSTEEQIFNQFASMIYLFIGIILIIGLIETGILYKTWRYMSNARTGEIENKEQLDKAELGLRISIITSVINFLIPIIFGFLYFRENLGADAFDSVVNYLIDASAQTAIISGIGGIIYAGSRFFAFYSFAEWTQFINYKYSNPMTNDANDGIEKVKQGMLAYLIAAGLSLIGIPLFNGLINLIGLVLTLIGMFKAGKALSYFTDLQHAMQSKFQQDAAVPDNQFQKEQVMFEQVTPENEVNRVSHTDGVRCPNCNTEFTSDGKFCAVCGTPKPVKQSDENDITDQAKSCGTCGSQISGEGKFCNNCGSVI